MNFADVKEWRIPEGEVTKVTDSQNRVIWQKPDDLYNTYFYLENRTSSSKTIQLCGEVYNLTDTTSYEFDIYYSTDQTNWTKKSLFMTPSSMSEYTKYVAVTSIPAGRKVYFKVSNSNNKWYTNNDYTALGHQFYLRYTGGIDNVFNCGGNIMSLMNGTLNKYFNNTRNVGLNLGHLHIYSAQDLVFPYDTYDYCFASLFYRINGIRTLTIAPRILPSTTLSKYCYANMFHIYPSYEYLETTPILPATTLVEGCYQEMFYNQKGITNANIYATNGVNSTNCHEMFGLTSTPTTTLPAVLHIPSSVSPSVWSSTNAFRNNTNKWSVVNDL